MSQPERDFKTFLRESPAGAFLVAGTLCAVCSVFVAGAAVALKPAQDANKEVFKQKNALVAAGLATMQASPAEVRRLFKESVESQLIDLKTGEAVEPDDVDFELDSYDPAEAAKDPDLSEAIAPASLLPGIARRGHYAFVYTVLKDGKPDAYVFPIYGKGLWSTLFGFLAVEADGRTVRGITYYQHAETPGLGGEVDNPGWKAQWKGKHLYDTSPENSAVRLAVLKGRADDDYGVDGLSGATITSRGVDTMLKYWLGPEAFGKFLEKQRGA